MISSTLSDAGRASEDCSVPRCRITSIASFSHSHCCSAKSALQIGQYMGKPQSYYVFPRFYKAQVRFGKPATGRLMRAVVEELFARDLVVLDRIDTDFFETD